MERGRKGGRSSRALGIALKDSAGKGRHYRYSGGETVRGEKKDDRQTLHRGEPVSPEINMGTFVCVRRTRDHSCE